VTSCQTCKHWMHDVATIFMDETGWKPCLNSAFNEMIGKSMIEDAGWIYTSPEFVCAYYEAITP
jgi:hypothetical protein